VAVSAALFVVLAALAFLMLGPGAPSYNIKVYFLNAAQLVKGNDVQIAGTKVGTVQDLAITPNGQAEATIEIDSSDYTPLREGTRAVIRLQSISG
jgi:phospholipid/cholesterol/gamma-HCH transport system substrate-binding protein